MRVATGIGCACLALVVWTGCGRTDLIGVAYESDAAAPDAPPPDAPPGDDSTWARTYGGPEDEYAWAVLQRPDGGYFVAGQCASFPMAWNRSGCLPVCLSQPVQGPAFSSSFLSPGLKGASFRRSM